MTSGIKAQDTGAAILHTGTVVAVCYSAELINGVGKEVHTEGKITKWGIPGDCHYGETRTSSSTGQQIPNDRPVTVVGAEAARDACKKLGIPEVPIGGLGENLHIQGAGDLSDLREGDNLRFMPSGGDVPSVVLRVRLQNDPCSNLKLYHKLMVKELFGKRGVICTVTQEGHVRVGDKVVIVRSSTE